MVHAKWKMITDKPGLESSTVEGQLLYVRGYILALEDVLKDIRASRAEYGTILALTALNDTIATVSKSLGSARATEKELLRLRQQREESP